MHDSNMPDFRHYAGGCGPACRAAACACGHCAYDHAISPDGQTLISCTAGCGRRCTAFADSGLSIQARAIIGAVREAAGIPYGASVGDGERYRELLAARVMHLTVALEGIARGGGPALLAWQLEHLREKLAGCPVDYRTDYAEVLADMPGPACPQQ